MHKAMKEHELDEIDRAIEELGKENIELLNESRKYISRRELPPERILNRLKEIGVEMQKYSTKLVKLVNP